MKSGVRQGGRFEIVRQLGEGGTGTVHEARDRWTGARVAIKRLRGLDDELLAATRVAFRRVRDVAHQNLVQLYELHEGEDELLLSMELVEGVELGQHVRPGGVLDEARLRASLLQLVAGLSALHAAGLVHGDVKPANVLVTSAGRVVVVDAGASGDGKPSDSDAAAATTPAYVAPEVAAGQHATPAADWYGLGVLLYQALTGELPFDGKPLAVLMRKQHEPAPAPTSKQGLPADLDGLCRELLVIDPAERPGGEHIRDVLAGASVLPRQARATPFGQSVAPPFVGREAELFALGAALDDSRRGRVNGVLLTGESGIGKSALIRRFLRESEGDAAVVLSGRCYPRASLAFRALDGVFEQLADRLLRLPPAELGARLSPAAALLPVSFAPLRRVPALAGLPRAAAELADRHTARIRLFAALRELVLLVLGDRPLVLTLDDLQWADDDSLALLTELLAPGLPALVVASWRPTPEAAEPPLLPGRVHHFALGALSESQSERLAALLLEQLDGPAPASHAAALARESGGHPLFLAELVRHRADSHAELDDILRARAGKLPPRQRELCELLAVAGAPLSLAEAARGVDADLDELVRDLVELRDAHLVRSSGLAPNDVVEPVHDRVASAITGRLDRQRQQALHMRLAQLIAAGDRVDDVRLAHHLTAAGLPAVAVDHARRGAEAALAALAFRRAATLWATVAELSEGEAVRRAHIERGHALALAGRGKEAAEAYLAAVAGAQVADAMELRRLAAEQLLVTGRLEEGLAQVRSSLAHARLSYPVSPGRALATLYARRLRLAVRGLGYKRHEENQVSAEALARVDLAWQMGLALVLVDYVRGQAFHAQCLQLALDAGEPRRIGRSLAMEVVYHATDGTHGLPRANSTYELSVKLAGERNDVYALALATATRGFAAFQAGDFRAAAEMCGRALDELSSKLSGVPWERATTATYLARAHLLLGQLGRLREETAAWLREMRARGDLYGETNLRATVLPILHLAGGDVEAAREAADHALDRWPTVGLQLQHYFQVVSQCAVDLYSGDPEAALRRLEIWRPLARAAHLLRPQFIKITLFDLRGRARLAAAALGKMERKQAQKLARADAAAIDKLGAAWARPAALALRASASDDDGERQRGFAAAAAGWDGLGLTLHARAARLRLGQAELGDEKIADGDRFAAMLVPP